MLTACGTGGKQNEQNGENSKAQQSEQSSQKSEDESGREETVGNHTLYIYDADKNSEMTATFYNSMTGKSQDVTMQKVG